MHDIAPTTTTSDRAASHGHGRHAGRKHHGVLPPPTSVSVSPEKTPEKASPKSTPLAQIADLDEGDILLHVLGTGLGPDFCAFVCGVATRLRLRGWSRCESGALTIRAVGREPELAALVHEIRLHAPADCSVRSIEPDAGDGGAPLPDHGFIPITEVAPVALATGTSSGSPSAPDW